MQDLWLGGGSRRCSLRKRPFLSFFLSGGFSIVYLLVVFGVRVRLRAYGVVTGYTGEVFVREGVGRGVWTRRVRVSQRMGTPFDSVEFCLGEAPRDEMREALRGLDAG